MAVPPHLRAQERYMHACWGFRCLDLMSSVFLQQHYAAHPLRHTVVCSAALCCWWLQDFCVPSDYNFGKTEDRSLWLLCCRDAQKAGARDTDCSKAQWRWRGHNQQQHHLWGPAAAGPRPCWAGFVQRDFACWAVHSLSHVQQHNDISWLGCTVRMDVDMAMAVLLLPMSGCSVVSANGV